MQRLLITTAFSLVGAFGAIVAPANTRAPARPAIQTVYTSTREISCLAVEPNGTLWAGTTGGVLRREPNGRWRKFTRMDGLPAHETRRLWFHNGTLMAAFPQARAWWRDGRWRVANMASFSDPNKSRREEQTCAATWRGGTCMATLTGLRWQEGRTWHNAPLPTSRGTHVSALLPRGGMLWAALFGDGLWAFDGKTWQPIRIGLPAEAREITAMAARNSTLWLGTRRAGIWEYHNRVWKQHVQRDEPCCHNAQAFGIYQNRLFVSTLEDGLAVRANANGQFVPSNVSASLARTNANGSSARGNAVWQEETPPFLSSVAPRQMVEFGGALYLRHGNGKVDRCSGRTWTRDVCAKLPRKQAQMLAADPARLYVAQWGGWSEFDGKTWTHHLKLPALQGRSITALYPDGDTLWIGTQNRGLAQFDHRTQRLRWHDERNGLPDDWITAVARVGKTLYVGTYVGGLAQWDGAKWTAGKLRGANVTALDGDGKRGLWVATRTRLWHQTPSERLVPVRVPSHLAPTEIQAVCAVPDGLWVGTRTGIYTICMGIRTQR